MKSIRKSKLWLVAVAAFWALSVAVGKAESDPCLESFTKDFEIPVGGSTLQKIDSKDACKINYNNGRLADHNRRQGTLPKLKIDGEEKTLPPKLGDCELSLTATKMAYEALLKSRRTVCSRTSAQLTLHQACIQEPNKNCEQKFKDLVSLYQENNRYTEEAVHATRNFLENFPKQNQDAIDKYRLDLQQLEKAALERNNSAAQIKGGFPDHNTYLSQLKSSVSKSEGPLIAEQKQAKATVDLFLKKTNDFLSQEKSENNEKVAEFQKNLNGLDNSSLTDGNNYSVGDIGGGGNSTPPSTAGGKALAGLSLGATALGTSALGSSGGSSEMPSTTETEMPTPSPRTPPSTPLASSHPTLPTEIPTPVAPLAEEKDLSPAVKTETPLLAATAKEEKKPETRNPASPASNPSSTKEESLQAFQGDLGAPPPKAKKKTGDNGMGEVTALLDKMKSLFLMDGGALPGGPQGGPNLNLPPMPEMGENSYSGQMPLNGDWTPEQQGEEASLDAEVSLFLRVHSKHQNCAKRGLVRLTGEKFSP